MYHYGYSSPLTAIDSTGLASNYPDWYNPGDWLRYGATFEVGDSVYYPGAIIMDAYTGAQEGKMAWADGVIPFANPFESAGMYKSSELGLNISQAAGAISRDAYLSSISIAPKFGEWASGIARYEVGSKWLDNASFQFISHLNPIQRGEALFQLTGWKNALFRNSPGAFSLRALTTGPTPGGAILGIGLLQAADSAFNAVMGCP